jgi:hypothetical protein
MDVEVCFLVLRFLESCGCGDLAEQLGQFFEQEGSLPLVCDINGQWRTGTLNELRLAYGGVSNLPFVLNELMIRAQLQNPHPWKRNIHGFWSILNGNNVDARKPKCFRGLCTCTMRTFLTTLWRMLTFLFHCRWINPVAVEAISSALC